MCLSYDDIMNVSKKTTLGLFQNAIEISTADQVLCCAITDCPAHVLQR
jgi:hypothetical protein